MVLKQCGQLATIVVAPASLRVSMFCWASIEYTNSLPIRRAGSPVHVSAGPSTANLTPAVCSKVAMALVVFFARSSRAPAQPRGPRRAPPEQVLHVPADRAVDDRDLEIELFGPFEALAGAHAPRVALGLQVFQQRRRLGRESRLDQHLVAAHVRDVVDVLDVDWALLDTRTAVRTGPQHIRVDDTTGRGITDQRPLR